MDIQQKAALIAPIMRATTQELEHLGEQHSCIFAAAVLVGVLKARGFDGAYALTVRPRILNPSFTERLKQTQTCPTDPAILDRWAQEGCFMIAIGSNAIASNQKQWSGHLVVVLPHFFDERHAICDLTITQASKPEWSINLGPTFVRVPDSFVKGETEFKAPVNGSLIVYKAFPEDQYNGSKNLDTKTGANTLDSRRHEKTLQSRTQNSDRAASPARREDHRPTRRRT